MSKGSHDAVTGERMSFGESDEWRVLFETDHSVSTSRNRSPSPPKQVQFDMKGSSPSQPTRPGHLDLYNFDEPGTEDSRYVLTSPRSLEACGRFGIKPVELLHKSYEEFLDEFRAVYDANYSHEAVYEVFQEHERQRKRKLKLCREERERIIREQGSRNDDIIGDFTFKSSSHHKDKVYVARSGSISTPGHEGDLKDNRFNNSSSQSTPDLHQERKSQSFTFRDVRTRGESSDMDAEETAYTSPQVRRARSQWSIPKNSSAPSSPRITRQDSNSLSSIGGQTPNRTMSTECVLSAVGGKRISQKDHRIIDLMLSRHEEAERLRNERMMLDLEWDEQKKLQNDLRQARQRRRQADMYEQYTAKDARQYQAQARRQRNEQKQTQGKQDAIRSKEAVWQQERQKQEQVKANKIKLKRMAEAEKKRQQEENRRRKEREDEMTRNMAYLTLLDKHELAMKTRNRQTTREQLKLKIRNEAEKIKISEKKEHVVRRSREEELSMRQQISEKHVRAVENYESQLAKRDSELRSSKRKKMEKVARQREELHRMESELSEWQKNLKAYREESLKRAETVASMNVAKKQLKSRTHLAAKTIEHADNYDRVIQDNERRRQEVQQVIGMKDERSQMVNMEKEEVRKLSREAAVTSQAVRNIVKEQTLKGSFDSMAHAAQVQARVGRGPQTGHKNHSTVRLG